MGRRADVTNRAATEQRMLIATIPHSHFECSFLLDQGADPGSPPHERRDAVVRGLNWSGRRRQLPQRERSSSSRDLSQTEAA